jgi:hypothetical protein
MWKYQPKKQMVTSSSFHGIPEASGLGSLTSFNKVVQKCFFSIPAAVFMAFPKLRDCAVPQQYCWGHPLHPL